MRFTPALDAAFTNGANTMDVYATIQGWCNQTGHTLVMHSDTHWQICGPGGKPKIDVWPTVEKWLPLKHKSGTKASRGIDLLIDYLAAESWTTIGEQPETDARRINKEAEAIADAAAPMIAEAVMKQLGPLMDFAKCFNVARDFKPTYPLPKSGMYVPIDKELVQECRQAVEESRPKPAPELTLWRCTFCEAHWHAEKHDPCPFCGRLQAVKKVRPLFGDDRPKPVGDAVADDTAAVQAAVDENWPGNEPEGEAAYREDRIQCQECGALDGLHDVDCPDIASLPACDKPDAPLPVYPEPTADILDLSADEWFERAAFLVALHFRLNTDPRTEADSDVRGARNIARLAVDAFKSEPRQ